MRFTLVTIAALMAAPAMAQSAFVLAPEQSSGMSFALTLEDAVAFATEECIYGGVEQGFGEAEMAETCQLTSACAFGDWAIQVSLGAEIHWSEFYCGLPTEAAARGLAALVCDLEDREHIEWCELVQIFDGGRPLIDR